MKTSSNKYLVNLKVDKQIMLVVANLQNRYEIKQFFFDIFLFYLRFDYFFQTFDFYFFNKSMSYVVVLISECLCLYF